MGYHSSLHGEIDIKPPLKWAQFKDSPYHGREKAQANHKCLAIDSIEQQEETEDGPLTRRLGVSVMGAWERAEKIYDVVTELQELVDAYPDHQFVGEMRGTGTDFGDIWLLRVDPETRKAERVVPTITWPDGTVLLNTRYR